MSWLTEPILYWLYWQCLHGHVRKLDEANCKKYIVFPWLLIKNTQHLSEVVFMWFRHLVLFLSSYCFFFPASFWFLGLYLKSISALKLCCSPLQVGSKKFRVFIPDLRSKWVPLHLLGKTWTLAANWCLYGKSELHKQLQRTYNNFHSAICEES